MATVQSQFNPLQKGMFVLIVLVFLAAGLWWVVSSSDLLPHYLLEKYLAKNYPDVLLESFFFQSRSITFPDQLSMNGAQLVLTRGENRFELSFDRLEITRLIPDWRGSSHVQITLEKLEGRWKDLSWNNAQTKMDVFFEDGKVSFLEGTWKLSRIQYGLYEFTEVSSSVEGDGHKVRFPSLSSEGYGGSIKGQFTLEYDPKLSYSAGLELQTLNLRLLGAVNPEVFSKVEGIISGIVAFTGNPSGIQSLEGNLDIPKGGMIKAVWLKPMVEYIPASSQRDELEGLIKKNSGLPIQQVSVKFNSIGEDSLKTEVNLTSRLVQLVDSTVDLNVEGGLKGLLLPLVLFSQ